jgi:hypothetical protein
MGFVKDFTIITSALAASMVLGSFMYSNAAASGGYNFGKTHEHIPVSNDAIKIVNRSFQDVFIGSEWRYKGAKTQGKVINAYIQIPDELNMSRALQKNYVRQAICPSAEHKEMWNEIKGTQLSVHLYVGKQKKSVYANCTNPYSDSNSYS